MNELIREYLQSSGYEHTLKVFVPETGLGDPLGREFLSK